MAKEKSKAEREKEDRRRSRFWNAAQLVLSGWLGNKFNFTFDRSFEPADIEGPVIVVFNHSCAYDPLFVGRAFKNKRLTFVASEHLLRMKTWGPFLERNISFIPHQKGARSSRTALVMMKRIKRGESIFLSPEGEQTWNGSMLSVMPYTGKMVKGSGATLVTYRIEGGYLSFPRWAKAPRRGRVYGHPVNVYSPETLKEMSDEEVEAAIARDIRFDTWEWQKSLPDGPVSFRCSKGGNAEGIERAVFTCPSCGKTGTLRSAGDIVSCGCGFRLRLTDTGFFDPPEPFETVADWEALDRKTLGEILAGSCLAADERELFSDDSVTLLRVEDGHDEKEAARGKLVLSAGGGRYTMTIGSYSFDMQGISNMTMVLAARVVFSDESGYYELRSEKGSGTNLRKYVIARELLKDITKE